MLLDLDLDFLTSSAGLETDLDLDLDRDLDLYSFFGDSNFIFSTDLFSLSESFLLLLRLGDFDLERFLFTGDLDLKLKLRYDMKVQ